MSPSLTPTFCCTELVHYHLGLDLGVVQVGREHGDGVADLHICMYLMPSSIGIGICVAHAWHLRGVRRVYSCTHHERVD